MAIFWVRFHIIFVSSTSLRGTVHINKLTDAAAKSELKSNCEKFDSELEELRKLDGLADSCVSSGMTFWKGTEKLAH